MTPERWREVSRLYAAALRCDAADRAAYLDQVCSGDPNLRREVESLLLHDDSNDGLAEAPLMDPLPSFVGQTIGPYAVHAALGAGGMGRVYRARDTRLGREVALKILPALSTLDADRLARFRREAHLLASLNHENIAQIYGIEDSGGVYGLVLELVEGPTLADRIAQGPLSLSEAIPIARQICSALHAAHSRGIVHRDLKPANIKVRPDGTVKVLDFGLAKALAPDPVGTNGDTPSEYRAVTARSVILGTVPYMAPEQARGKETDKRVDIWAFGVVLYEVLTGRSPFAADTLADTVAAVLHNDPDWQDVPERLRPLLQRCLEKDPARRLQDIADARLWLEDARPSPVRRVWPAVAAAAAAIFFVTTLILAIEYFRAQPAAVFPVRLQIAAPPQSTFGTYFVVSPDGRHIAFQAEDSAGRLGIWVHSFEWGESRPLTRAGQINGASIFWSADSRFIGFVDTDATLKKIEISGGPPQTICDLPGNWGGATWSRDDIIVFGQREGGLMRVSAAGGVPTPVTRLARREIGHGGPRFLPDGRHFIYSRASEVDDNTALYVGSLDVAPEHQGSKPLLVTSSRGVYAPTANPKRGYLLIVQDAVLLAHPFDAERLALDGDPLPIADDVGAIANGPVSIASASVSNNGVLAFRTMEQPNGVPVWVDRNGREVGMLVDTPLDQLSWMPRISPDGTRVALNVAGDLWVYHTDGRPPIRLTLKGNAGLSLWTPDGTRIIYMG